MHQIKHILMESFLRVVTVRFPNFYKYLMYNIQKERKEYSISKLFLGSDFEIFTEGEKAYFLVCFKVWSKSKKERNWEDSMKTGSVCHSNLCVKLHGWWLIQGSSSNLVITRLPHEIGPGVLLIPCLQRFLKPLPLLWNFPPVALDWNIKLPYFGDL